MADSGAIARKRRFVQQRVKELEAKGKKADRAKLRRKWETGMVERDEFYAPGERARLRAGNKKKKPAPGPRQGSPVDRMPEKKAPKQGKPADRMPQGGPRRMKPADRYPGRRPGTSVTPNMETPKPKNPGPKQGKPADRMPQGGPKRMKPADRYPGRRPGTSVTPNMETPKPGSGPRAGRPRTGPGGVMLPRRGNTVTPNKETPKPSKPKSSKPKQGPGGYALPSTAKKVMKPAPPVRNMRMYR